MCTDIFFNVHLFSYTTAKNYTAAELGAAAVGVAADFLLLFFFLFFFFLAASLAADLAPLRFP